MTALDELFSGDDGRALAALDQIAPADLPRLTEVLAGGPPARHGLPGRARDARAWAAIAIGQLPGDGATAALSASAADPDPEVRAAVLHALGQQRSDEALTPLLFALSDPSAYLARIATDALIHLGQAAVPRLLQALEHEAEARVRVNLVRALALIGDTRAIPALFRALEDESHVVQHWADEGLERMGVGQVYFRV